IVTSPLGVDDGGSDGFAAVPPVGTSDDVAGLTADRSDVRNVWRLRVRRAEIPAPRTSSTTAAVPKRASERLMSLPFVERDRGRRAGRQVRSDGAFQISDGLVELAERAVVVQLRSQ